MSILTLQATDPNGELLAMRAGEATEIPVGFDPEFECATFDAETLGDDELRAVVFDALAGLDPDWQTHLRLAD
jgi:hypothetical protein